MENKDIDTVKEELIAQAKEKGICGPWAARMAGMKTLSGLVSLYVRGIDFCFDNDFPTLDYMKRHFKGICEKRGLYVEGEDIRLKNPLPAILVGDTKADIRYDSYSVGRVYLKHTAMATIEAADHAIILAIDCFDTSHVDIKASGSAKVTVYLYGESTCNAEETDGAQVKIVRKKGNTYE